MPRSRDADPEPLEYEYFASSRSQIHEKGRLRLQNRCLTLGPYPIENKTVECMFKFPKIVNVMGSDLEARIFSSYVTYERTA